MASEAQPNELFNALNMAVKNALTSVVLNPVDLTLIFNEFEVDSLNNDDEIDPELFKWVCGLTWDSIVLQKHKLHMVSDGTGNDDTRGGGCGKMDIPSSMFSWKTENPKGITLRNLTEAVYRMKGSKYDWWYELFSDITLLEETEDGYKIIASFDYGS